MFERIQKLLSAQLDIDIEKIKPETDIMEELGADSLDVVELLTALEDELKIAIPQDEIVNVHTVGELADVIDRL